MLALFIGCELLKALGKTLVPGLAAINPVALFSSPQQAPDTILANLLLIQSIHLYDFLTWNVASWSISTEFYTYVIFAVCLVGLRKHARVALLFAMIGGPVLIAILSKQNMHTDSDWGIIRCIYGFAAGVACWNVYRRWNGKLGKWLSGNIAEWCTIGFMFVFVSVSGNTLISLAAPYVFGLVVFVFAFEAGTASAILRVRPLVFLGTISYSIYMTHVFIGERLFNAGGALAKLWHVDPFTHREINGRDFYFLGTHLWQGDIAYPVYLAMIIAVSYFTYRWIEKPAREWARNRVRIRQQQAATSRGVVSA